MACGLTAALWLRQERWELGARGQGHSRRRDKLKEPLEKQAGPTITTTPQQGLQSSSRVKLEVKEETLLLLGANRNQEPLHQREKRNTRAQKKNEERQWTEGWKKEERW